jgi:hypothetical protein
MALIAGVSGTLAFVDTRPVAVRAHEWALTKGTSLPSTLDELSEYPVEYRRAAFKQLAPAQQSALVREHLTKFLGSETLTPQQRDLVNRMIQIVSPEAYGTGNEQAQKAMGEICTKVSPSFDRRQQALLSTLGPIGASESALRRMARATKTFLSLPHVNAKTTSIPTLGSCDCNLGSWCSCVGVGNCGGDEACWDAGGRGCGCGWLYPCNGSCVPAPGH